MGKELIERFSVAWTAKDVDACMACFTDDAVFAAAAGDGPGTVFAGKAAIRAQLERIFNDDALEPLVSGRHMISGNLGMMEWSLDRRMTDGTTKTFRGVDVYEFRDDLISLKDSYRKCLPEADV